MNKKIKFFLIILVLIVVAACVFFIVKFKPFADKKPAIILRQPSDKIIGAEKIIVPEFMTAAEKTAMGLEQFERVQVLYRDNTGQIREFKVINEDKDIVTDFYPPEVLSQMEKKPNNKAPEPPEGATRAIIPDKTTSTSSVPTSSSVSAPLR